MNYDQRQTVQINDFTIYFEKLLGEGAQAKVFEAKQQYFDEKKNQKERIIVAKVITLTQMNAFRLDQEAQIFHELKKKKINKNIVQTYELCQHVIDDTRYQISFMEKCESDLSKLMKEKLRKNEWFSFTEILNFASQIINGYKLLIECNIIHRDLKPDNILVTYENQETILKICDFGVGKCLNEDAARTHLGTPLYTPPEGLDWIKINTPYSNKFDVYSLGIIFYQLVYKGNLPFNKAELKKFIDELKVKPFVCPPCENVDQEFLKLIDKMITYDVDDRLDWISITNHEFFNVEQQQILQNDPNKNPVISLIQYLGLIYHYSNKLLQILDKIPQNLINRKLDFLILTSIIYKLQNYFFESFEQIKNKQNFNNISLVKSITIKQLEDSNLQQIDDELQKNSLLIDQNYIKQKIQEAKKIFENEKGNNYTHNLYYPLIFGEDYLKKDQFDYWFLTYQSAYKDVLRAWLQGFILKKIITIEDAFQLERFSNIPQEYPKQNYLLLKQSQLSSKIVVKDKAAQYLHEKGIL